MITQTPLDSGWRLSLLAGPVPDGVVIPDAVPAVVPGCVHTDLLAAGVIPDPLDGDNEARLAWMWRCDWRYRTVFRASAADEGEHVELVLEGLDTFAVVTLNGVELGRGDNQFRRYRYEVGHLLREGGNELVVDLASALNEAERREGVHGHYPHVNDHPFSMVRKSACSFGWDWGPVTVTAGIWKPVRLERWSGARVRDVRLGVDLDGGRGEARLVVEIEREAGAPPSTLHYTVAGASVRAVVDAPGVSEAVLEVSVPDVEPWWPRGYGDQRLYDSRLDLDGREVWSRRVGFRRAAIDLSPDGAGSPLRLLVNGGLVLVKGVNWIPDDVFPTRLTRERYRRALADAVDSGCNTVRVWGGGLYESEDFYDAADELGLLVWQDFMFACAAYSEESWLSETVVIEARQAVGRLAGRASLVLWCGGNETETGFQEWGWREELAGRPWGRDYYRRILPGIVAELDPTTPYIPSSPFSPDPWARANNQCDGDTHVWDVWNEADYLHYADHAPRFASEFGFGGPMAYSTLRAAVHDEPLGCEGVQLAVHQKAEDGFAKLQRGIDNHLVEPADFRRWHWATQLNQARALDFGISHFRSLQPSCSGSLIWQLNDCWPVISWAVVDSAGVRKPGWYALRRAQADRMLVLEPAGEGMVRLIAVNDLPEAWSARVRVGRGARHGLETAWQDEPALIEVGPRAAASVELPLPDDPDDYLVARAEEEDVRRAMWFVSTDRLAGLPESRARVEVERIDGGYRVRVAARVLLRDLALTADEVLPGCVVDDMLVTLLPGESATFTVRAEAELEDPSVLGAWPLLRSANDLV